MIAERMAKAAGDADVFPIADMPEDLSSYEVVAIGYWLRRGGPDPQTMSFLPKVHDAKVVLFQTHGADPGSEQSRNDISGFCLCYCHQPNIRRVSSGTDSCSIYLFGNFFNIFSDH